MIHEGQCQFKNIPNPITVGTVLQLSCKSQTKLSFKKYLFIQFPDQKDKNKLQLLKVVTKDQSSVDLEVTSYQPGDFAQEFSITDGSSTLKVKGLSFTVKSTILKGEKISSHPPLGPWQESVPLWYLSLWGFTGFFIFIFGVALIFKFIKRKSFIKFIQEQRNVENPVKRFIKEARAQNIKSYDCIPHLEKLFKSFLEDLLFIQTEKKEAYQIAKEIKKYEPTISKKYGQDVVSLLKEFKCFRNKRLDEFTSLQLKKTCYQLVFDLEREKKS